MTKNCKICESYERRLSKLAYSKNFNPEQVMNIQDDYTAHKMLDHGDMSVNMGSKVKMGRGIGQIFSHKVM